MALLSEGRAVRPSRVSSWFAMSRAVVRTHRCAVWNWKGARARVPVRVSMMSSGSFMLSVMFCICFYRSWVGVGAHAHTTVLLLRWILILVVPHRTWKRSWGEREFSKPPRAHVRSLDVRSYSRTHTPSATPVHAVQYTKRMTRSARVRYDHPAPHAALSLRSRPCRWRRLEGAETEPAEAQREMRTPARAAVAPRGRAPPLLLWCSCPLLLQCPAWRLRRQLSSSWRVRADTPGQPPAVDSLPGLGCGLGCALAPAAKQLKGREGGEADRVRDDGQPLRGRDAATARARAVHGRAHGAAEHKS